MLAVAWIVPLPAALAASPEPAVLRISLESEPTSLDWTKPGGSADRFIHSFIMRGMMKLDASGSPVCDLCRAHAVSEDGLLHSFELEEQVNWSNGEPLLAEHFVDSLKRSAAFRRLGAGARAAGPRRVEIRLAKPSGALIHFLTKTESFPIRRKGPRSVLGPYQLVEWVRGKRLVLEANAAYPGARPAFRVDFTIGTHGDLMKRFRGGRLDILMNPTTAELMDLQGSTVQVSTQLATRILYFNARKGLSADASFRRAVFFALDRAQLPGILGNGERAAAGLLPPGIPGNRELPLVSHDPARARAERARIAGAGQSLSLRLLSRAGAADTGVARWIVDSLAPLGIQVVVSALGPKPFERAFRGGEFDLAVDVRNLRTAAALELLADFGSESSANPGRWAHVGFDSLLSRLQAGAGDAAALVEELTRILEAQETAVVPLSHPAMVFLLGPMVESFATTPFGDPDLLRIRLKR